MPLPRGANGETTVPLRNQPVNLQEPRHERGNTMKNTIRSLLLLSAVICVTPASANYFSHPESGTNLNIGSAPNPTPADLRRGFANVTRTDTPPLYVPEIAAIEAAPPPVEAPAFIASEATPLLAQAPPPPVIRQFIVFFDFDKSKLTPEASGVVAAAVTTAQNTGMARIMVVGHTDTVGSMRYNQALSERRAMAVKTEMMRLGLNAGDIATSGRSFLDPLVPTGRGVREPQNRRVVIDLNYNLTAALALKSQ
jgi:outer membrane protein OmpA-like peptidoglycan-associated protein